ncbi:MAG TPA: rod shape-determining protein RodA [Desulfotomaculum sp.]|nr:rod shape-determining protein RodA [Desulfotomaculum sp.]
MFNKRLYKSLDHTLLGTTIILIFFSLIMIGSASLEYTPESLRQFENLNIFLRLLHLDYTYFNKQILWIFLGIGVMALMVYVPYEDIIKQARFLYALNLFMLIMVLFIGHTALGAQRWIQIGPLTFQPSEFAKLLIIITFAAFLAKREGRLNGWLGLGPCFLYVGLPFIVILKQPDLGTSLVLIAIMFGMLFFAGAKPVHLLALLGIGIIFITGIFMVHTYLHQTQDNLEKQILTLRSKEKIISQVGGKDEAKEKNALSRPETYSTKLMALKEKYRAISEYHQLFHRYTLKEYQMNRLIIFLNPQKDILGAGYHIWQSLIAVGSGGLAGKGFLEGTQSHFTFLPIRHTDFIFSVVGEEMGFLGALFLLSLYFIILYRGTKIIIHARDNEGILLAGGIVTMFAFHVFVNVGMTIGIMPVTGIPLPLFSYGGSNIIMNLAALGLLLNIYTRRKKIIF